MMGFGSYGAYSSSSSSPAFSNLSALAPPFSIDRSNPNKLNSNPIPTYSDLTSGVIYRSNPNKLNLSPIPPYSELTSGVIDRSNASTHNSSTIQQFSELTCGVKPFSQTWQYPQPSAPRSELIVNSVVSVGLPSVPPETDVYQFLASTSTSAPNAYWSEPFYSPYVPPIASEGNHLPEDNGPRYDTVPPEVDYMQGLYDLEYGPRWMSGNLGSDYGKRTDEVELSGSLLSEKANFSGPHGYSNHLNQGHGTEYGSKYKENTGVSCERFNLVSSDLHTAYTGMRHMEDKPCLEQNLSFLSPYVSKTHISAASSTLLASRPLGPSSETHKIYSDHQNSCSTNKNSLRPVGSHSIMFVSTVRPSPAVVIRPPPVVSGLGQSGVSRSTAYNDTVDSPVFSDFDLTSSSNRMDLGQNLNAEVKEASYDTDLLNLSNRVDTQIFGSPSVKELSAPLHTKNTHDHDTKARFVSEPPNVNILDGFSDVQAFASAEFSSDSVDRHSLGVDSPCWKGAHSSQFSSLDVEDERFNYFKKNEFYCFDHEKHENNLPAMDSIRTSASTCEGNWNQRTESSHDGEVNTNDVNPEMRVSVVTRSIGVQINKDPDIPRKDSGISNNLKSGFDVKISKPSNSKLLIGEMDSGLTHNYVSDGDIAVHAAEKVLASPSSQDDTAERTKLQPDLRMDAPMVIKAMHNLSELLLFHQSNDTLTLEENDNETLKLIISNLESCMSKKITQPTNGPNLDYPIGDTSKLGDFRNVVCHNMSTTSDSPPKTNECKDSQAQRDYWSMYEEEYNNSGNKDGRPPVISPSRDDLDSRKEDVMAEAIKKVLDENFNFDEEMHSQAFLFKSLWLEAEAKLCSISYKARFDRMKREMEKLKPKAPIGNENSVEMLSKLVTSSLLNTEAKSISKTCDGLRAKPVIENSSVPSITVHADETETSIMTRFSILKSRQDNMNTINKEEEAENPEIAESDSAGSVMDRFNILKSRGENSKSCDQEEEKAPEASSAGFADQNQYGSQEMLNSSLAIDPMIHSFYDSSRIINQQYSLWRDSSSSDWEHVMKDDFAWKNS